MSGTYYWKYTCDKCGETVYEKVEVDASKAAYVKIVNDSKSSASNIEAFWIYSYYDVDGTTKIKTVSTDNKDDTDARFDIVDDYTALNSIQFSTSKTSATTTYSTLLADEQIELKDCTKDGYYYIEYYSKDNKVIGSLGTNGREKITVKAHHMEVEVAAFDSQADMDACTVSYDSNGNLVVKSSSCRYGVTYTKVTECYAECCSVSSCGHNYEKHVETNVNQTSNPTNSQIWNGIINNKTVNTCTYGELSSETAEAAASGAHVWLTDIYSALQKKDSEWKSATYTGTDGKTYSVSYTVDDIESWLNEKLEEKATAEGLDEDYYKDYVKITDVGTTCTSTGNVTITFYCTVHDPGEIICKTYVIKNVYPSGHLDLGYQEVEWVQEATCTQEGIYQLTHKCQRPGCDYEFEETETITTARLKHTNEEGVYDTTTSNYNNDTDNSNNASTIYLEISGDRVVDSSSLLICGFWSPFFCRLKSSSSR